MFGKIGKAAGFLCCLGILALGNPEPARAADTYSIGVEAKTSTSLVVKIEDSGVKMHIGADENSGVVGRAAQGKTYEVVDSSENGWLKVTNGSVTGYIPMTSGTIFETTKESVDENVRRRQEVVNYALQFVGGRYVYGGNDPHTGVDCSGFTKYVMQRAAGVTLNRSSRSQATQGHKVSRDEAQPGDLIFYGSGGYIDHVALYIGNNQIVHASTEKTGIIVSRWDHRPQVKIISVLD